MIDPELIIIKEQLSELIKLFTASGNIPKNVDPPTDENLITRDLLCKRLGISKPTVIRMEKKKIIKPIRVFGSIRYSWTDVLKSLEKQKTQQP